MSGREVLLEKINRKQEMESELTEQMEILRTNNVDMTCSLVDSEDYPRSDVDLYKIRAARQRISCLQNDLNSLIKEISTGLENHFSDLKGVDEKKKGDEASSTMPVSNETSTKTSAEAMQPQHKDPFAIINGITEGSPAEIAGFRLHDMIVEFGSLNAKNYEMLKQFADIAEHKLNKPVSVVVKRKRDSGIAAFETIQLVPKKWSGRGYLGMVVKPI